MTKAFALLVIVVLGACSDLPDIDANVCGNGILEAGEDCDASDSRCVQCGIRCDFDVLGGGDAQCAELGGADGFVCGADDFCHAPSGRFRAPTELSTGVETFRSSDIDNDGYGDLLVQSSTAIRVLFGNADGQPTTSTQALTPIARGAASYADLDLDPAHKLDILLPAADGIVAYTSPYDVLSPYPFPSIVAAESEGRPYFSNQIAPGFIGFVGTGPGVTSGPVFYFVRDVQDETNPGFVAMGPVCGATDQSFDPHAVSVFDVRANYQLFVTTYPQGVARKVCVLAIEKVGTSYSVTELPVNLGAVRNAASRPVFAPIGVGACPSIIVREQLGVQPPGDVIALAGTGTTTCSYSGAPSVRTLSTDKGDPVGVAPLVPPDGAATVALAMTSGVYAIPAAGPLVKTLYVADRPLGDIAAADIDDDGDVDIVASSVLATGERVEDIDVLSRISVGFTRFRFDTDGPVDLLTIGDYDGNGVFDVAYVQTRVIGGATRYELVIAYATGDQLMPGIGAGTYGRIIALIPGEIPDSNDPFSVVTDLVVLFEDSNQTAITLLHGSPQRTMLGFFDPRQSQIPTTFRGVVSGNFNDDAGPTGLDMVAIEDGLAGVPRVWRSNGPTGGAVMQTIPNTVASISDCSRGGGATDLCIDGAFYVAWPISATSDRVIAFGQDRSGDARIVTFDPHASQTALPGAAWPAMPELPPRAHLHSADVVRVAGAPLLVLTYRHLLQEHTLLCTVDASGLATTCADLGDTISSQVGHDVICTSATAARIRPVTRFMTQPAAALVDDLVVMCHDKANPDATVLFRVGENLSATELLRISRAADVRIGDVDGNGVDDFVTVDRESAVPTMRVYRQCTAREAPTCGS